MMRSFFSLYFNMLVLKWLTILFKIESCSWSIFKWLVITVVLEEVNYFSWLLLLDEIGLYHHFLVCRWITEIKEVCFLLTLVDITVVFMVIFLLSLQELLFNFFLTSLMMFLLLLKIFNLLFNRFNHTTSEVLCKGNLPAQFIINVIYQGFYFGVCLELFFVS